MPPPLDDEATADEETTLVELTVDPEGPLVTVVDGPLVTAPVEGPVVDGPVVAAPFCAVVEGPVEAPPEPPLPMTSLDPCAQLIAQAVTAAATDRKAKSDGRAELLIVTS